MARSSESQTSSRGVDDTANRTHQFSGDTEKRGWFDDEVIDLTGISTPADNPLDRGPDRSGDWDALPVEPVSVSTGCPSENLQQIALPPVAEPPLRDDTAELSPILMDLQLPEVITPRKRPDPINPNRHTSDLDPPISYGNPSEPFEATIPSWDHKTRPGPKPTPPSHRLRGMWGCLLLITIIAAICSVAVLAISHNQATGSTKATQSDARLEPTSTPLEITLIATPSIAVAEPTPPVPSNTPITPSAKEASSITWKLPERSQTRPSKPRRIPTAQPRISPKPTLIIENSIIPNEHLQPEEIKPVHRASVIPTPRPQPWTIPETKARRARPARRIAFPQTALRLLHGQENVEIQATVSVDRFGFPRSTEVWSSTPLPDLVKRLIERTINDVRWIPAKSESGKSVADVVSVRFRAVEGSS